MRGMHPTFALGIQKACCRAAELGRQVPWRSICEQVYLVQPDTVRLLFVVTIHLECDVDLLLVPLWLGCEVGVDSVSLIGNAQTDVMHLVTNAFQPPYQVNPCVRRKMIARDWNGNPQSLQRVPYIPLVRLVKVAL